MGLWFVLLFMGTYASAEVKLPKLISDNMVLQQGMKVRIWGTAEPGEKVAVAFRDQKVATEAGPDGRWEVYLQPLKAGGPDTLTISGNNTIALKDVLVGEVWVCSGQSNMAMPVGTSQAPAWNARQEIAAANYPMMRLFTVPMVVAGQASKRCEGRWVAASPQTVETILGGGLFLRAGFVQSAGRAGGLDPLFVGRKPGGGMDDAGPRWTPCRRQSLTSMSATRRWPSIPKQVEEFKQQYDDWLRAVETAEAEGKTRPSAPHAG